MLVDEVNGRAGDQVVDLLVGLRQPECLDHGGCWIGEDAQSLANQMTGLLTGVDIIGADREDIDLRGPKALDLARQPDELVLAVVSPVTAVEDDQRGRRRETGGFATIGKNVDRREQVAR